jgi:NADH-ubiquinone oxidoreductase chain 2
LIQYTISNLNAFISLILIGYTLYYYVYKKDKLSEKEIFVKERNNSPVQIINQIKGYFYVNPFLSLSLSITLFSFIGIPPLIGFYAKFMALFASINNGYIFMSIVAIVTSVISGVYYLFIIKQIFFEKTDYTLNPSLNTLNLFGILTMKKKNIKINFDINNIVLSSSLTIIVSILTLLILLFIFIFNHIFNITTILSLCYVY